jgi:hypothetical protein
MSEIADVQALAQQNAGHVTFDDLKYLRDGANGRTNFTSPDQEKTLFRGIGNAYRSVMDRIAPETTQLNRDYVTYKNLESVIDKNVSYGRGVTKSGLDKAIRNGADHTIGAGIGATLGHATGIPGGAWVGAVAGGTLYPKLATRVGQAPKNAAVSGKLSGLSEPIRYAIHTAARIGDGKAVMSILGGATKEAATNAAKGSR